MGPRMPVLLALALCAATAAAAEDAPAESCRTVADDARRLACYDRAYPPQTTQAAGAAPAAAASPAAAAPTRSPDASPDPPLTPEERFGREAAIERQEREREKQAERELGELRALVRDISRRSDGLMTITLDNGQVWQQVRPDGFRLKAGDAIRIEPASLGSYMMWGDSRRPTRVSRVR